MYLIITYDIKQTILAILVIVQKSVKLPKGFTMNKQQFHDYCHKFGLLNYLNEVVTYETTIEDIDNHTLFDRYGGNNNTYCFSFTYNQQTFMLVYSTYSQWKHFCNDYYLHNKWLPAIEYLENQEFYVSLEYAFFTKPIHHPPEYFDEITTDNMPYQIKDICRNIFEIEHIVGKLRPDYGTDETSAYIEVLKLCLGGLNLPFERTLFEYFDQYVYDVPPYLDFLPCNLAFDDNEQLILYDVVE